jgi:hypothetical protein
MPYQSKPGVCDCSETPLLEEEAIILYPSLGTPLLLAAGQTKASIFIAAPSSMRGKAAAGQLLSKEAVCMYKLVDQHLRVVDIDDKQESGEAEGSTRTGTLFSDGKDCATAKRYVTGWRVGEFRAGALITDRHGRAFATIAPAAAQLYTKVQDVYEIELDFSAPPFAKLQAPGSLASLAWMIRLGTQDKKLAGFEALQHAEAQDLAIARFLAKQKEGERHHFGTLHEFTLPGAGANFTPRLPAQNPAGKTLLKSWHPVKRLEARPLKLGHLSDVHVNVRHNALAGSYAKVLEDEGEAKWNQRVGAKVCNSFEALRQLFEQMAQGPDKADAVLFTGDLIDFNRNLNPAAEGAGGGVGNIGRQWKAFNLLGNIFDKTRGPQLYPRGLDDMLVYSLVREMYRKHKLPILMTSGNHEAYQVPYGISARVEPSNFDNWAFMLGVFETMGARRHVLDRHLGKLEEASAWVRGKANEGMSRDHNMTIYEACLAYGPTYGHALTGSNFHGGQFDWFYALFTPLADVVIAYGAESTDKTGAGARQVIAALGWGTDENYKNLGELGGGETYGLDRQGAGILPRAVESFSDDQLTLVSQARKYKGASHATLTVATHFTIVSFDEPEPYSNVVKAKARASFVPANGATGLAGMKAAFNHVNVGTCERNQATYLEEHIGAPGRRSRDPAVDWHLSGHSHRSGVYKVQWEQDYVHGGATRRMQVVSAQDPGIHGAQTAKPDTHTALIVTSSGGPIGYQNLDGELSAWTGRPPAGTLLDTATGQIRQVSTSRCHIEDGRGYNEKPRLAVALDYLHVMSGIKGKGGLGKEGAIEVPLRFKLLAQLFGTDTHVELELSEQVKKLGCIESVTLWVFEGDKKSGVKQWHRIAANLDKSGAPARLTLVRDSLAPLARAFAAGLRLASGVPGSQFGKARRIQAAFCEVGLHKPTSSKAPEDWAKDMQCTDPWVFPVDVFSDDGKTLARIERSGGERGEVPDWEFLALNFKDKGYVPAKDAIKMIV